MCNLLCVIETSCVLVGFVWQAGSACITRFLAGTQAEFPVYFQRSMFILGDWGRGGGGQGMCVIKGLSSASIRV